MALNQQNAALLVPAEVVGVPAEPPVVSKVLTCDLLKFIPTYDGTSYKLYNYISALQDLLGLYCGDNIRERESNHWLLLKAAMCKLEGPAEAVALNNNVTSVTGLVTVLKNNFADNRTVPDLIAELALMKAYSREHPLEFLNRLDEKRTVVLTRYRLDNIHGEALAQLQRQLDATLVRTLQHGVHPTLGAHLQVLGIRNLEDARSKLINDCSIVLEQLNQRDTLDVMNRSRGTRNFRVPNYNSRGTDPRPGWFQRTQSTQRAPQGFTSSFRKGDVSGGDRTPTPGKRGSSSGGADTQGSGDARSGRNYVRPHESAHIHDKDQHASLALLTTRVDSLCDAVDKLAVNFLDLGPGHPGGPPVNHMN